MRLAEQYAFDRLLISCLSRKLRDTTDLGPVMVFVRREASRQISDNPCNIRAAWGVVKGESE
jgi:hypothetical protein